MLTNEEKREAIEKALRPYIPKSIVWSPEQFGRVVDALAEGAIVVECEVEQDGQGFVPGDWKRTTIWRKGQMSRFTTIPGHQGRPGKALAIIILEEASNESRGE